MAPRIKRAYGLAVMGLTAAGGSRSNRTQADGPCSFREVDVGAADHRMAEVDGFDRLWWLPAGGFGNGLDDASWVVVVDVSGESVAREVLDQLFASGVPAYAASLPRLESARLEPARRGGGQIPVRVWVGATRFGKARDVLLGLLPRLVSEHGQGVIL